MAARDVAAELQAAVADRLEAAMGADVAIHDDVPRDLLGSIDFEQYVEIGDADWIPDDTKTDDGQRHTLVFHAWVGTGHRGRYGAKLLLARIHEALQGWTPEIEGCDVQELRWTDSGITLDEDRLIAHGVSRYETFTEDATV